MSHMVMFRSAEGKPGYHQIDSLDEAIAFVEHLRNEEQVPEARIFRMEEIPIAVKTYYKVEVSPVPSPAAAAPAPESPVGPPGPSKVSSAPAAAAPGANAAREKVSVPAQEPVVAEPASPANGGPPAARFGRFNRS